MASMAKPEFSNSHFINLKSDVEEVLRILETTGAQRVGVRASDPASKERAMDKIHEDLQNILETPLTAMIPSGYGGLPMDAVQPIRQLHRALLEALAQEETEDGKDLDPAKLDAVYANLKSLVTSIDPNHPFLRLQQKDSTEVPAVDEAAAVDGDGDLAAAKENEKPAKKQQKKGKENKLSKKAQGKQPAKPTGTANVQGSTGVPGARRSERVFLRQQQHSSYAEEAMVEEMVGNAADVFEDDVSGGEEPTKQRGHNQADDENWTASDDEEML